MRPAKMTLKTSLISIMMTLVLSAYPLTALAQEAPADQGEVSEAEKQPTYTYNPDTNRWDSEEWRYDPVTGVYVPAYQPPPAQQPPEAPLVEGEQEVAPASPTANNTIDSNSSTATDTDIKTDVDVKNGVTGTSKSGNAGVKSNTYAGGANSGDATADATIMNVVHSTVQGDTEGIAHFTADIHGNVYGDITLTPKGSNNAITSNSDMTSTTDIKSKAALTNDVELDATSGDAAVAGNTEAGGATSGNAHTVANILNLINTIIAANQSFVGTINIYGNLDGDILVSPDFIPQLIADNSATLGDNVMNSLDVDLNDKQKIVNNITLDADTGDATVANNTEAGAAKTGSANTNLTVLNLTGREVVAKNSLLVFVNVLGKWVGLIVDAPVGATAAMYGSDVTKNISTQGSSTIDADTEATITNNIRLASKSGDASVTDNTKAGGATSGDATASANVLNIATSSFNISDWFGVLFINVFGTWHGSFGINTKNGDIIPLDVMPTASANPTSAPPPFEFGFVPRPSSTSALGSFVTAVAPEVSEAVEQSGDPVAAVLASSSGDSGALRMMASTVPPNPFTDPFLLTLMISGAVLFAGGTAIELRARRRISPIA